jgi:glycosyltransferase involved in cell wall biosynthesis
VKILYAALDQRVPGTTGGSVHVTAVADGLAARGHAVTVLTSAGAGPFPAGAVRWETMGPPLGVKYLRAWRAGAVEAAARRCGADVIIERYYNFGGEGVRAARATGALAVLEVNAPVIDYPGSPKSWIDRALLVEPMRRWRDHLCGLADLIVTPTAAILPPHVAPERIVEVEWGADTNRFRPGAGGPAAYPAWDGVTAVFAGAFRAWHGAASLVRAARTLQAWGRRDIRVVLIGDGPEHARVSVEARGLDRVLLTGALPHADMPAALAAAHIGVAPFDVSAHAPLQLAFYWSPLKVFEYMAAGLPVVAPVIDRLAAIVRDGEEGVLFGQSEPDGLAHALARLAGQPDLRQRMGAAARARAVSAFSWQAHCARLEAAFTASLQRRPA